MREVHSRARVVAASFATAVGLCAALLSRSAAGDVPLTRGAAVALALRQNPTIAAARAVEAQSAARGAQAHAAAFPRISLTGAVGPSVTAHLVPGSGIESTRSSADLNLRDLSVVVGGELQVLQPLYTFGKLSERQRAAALELAAREAQTDMTRADVAFQVAELYEAYLFASDASAFFTETLHWLERTVEETQREIEEGTGANEQDLLRLNTAQGVARLGLSRADAAKAQTLGGLVAYLGFAPGTLLVPGESGLELLPALDRDLPALIKLALGSRPELRGLDAGSKAYLALANAEEADSLPDIFALGYLSAAYTPGRDWIDSRFVIDPLNHLVPGVLVGARWQFTGDMASQRGAENRARASELSHLSKWAQLAVPAEVTRAYEDVKRAEHDASEAAKATGLAKRWAVSASADYSVGLGDSRNVTEASTAYVQLRLAEFDARFRHNVALAQLAKVTGTLVADVCPFYPTRAAGAAPTPPVKLEKTPAEQTKPPSSDPAAGSSAAGNSAAGNPVSANSLENQ
ncbi:MAG TPA: TolC family protein [Polyangiaceae bacterium]|nr:TolC family protein [Polyangiaceae bacterium]